MSLAKGLIIVGLGIGVYFLYTKFVSQIKTPTVPKTQEQLNAIQVSGLGLDPSTGVGSVVISALGGASADNATLQEFVDTHDYGAFTRAVLNENIKQQNQAQPVFTSREQAAAWGKSHS